MKAWFDHFDIPEKLLGCILAIGGLIALIPKLFRVMTSFYHGAVFTIEIRDHMRHMETRIIDRLSAIDDGQCNILEVRRQMLDADLSAAWFMTDAHGKTEWVNRTWSVWTGLSNHESRGNGWENAIAPEDRPRAMQGWQLAVDHQRSYSDTYHFIDRTGKRTLVDVIINPIRKKDGTVLDYFGSARIRGDKSNDGQFAAAQPTRS